MSTATKGATKANSEAQVTDAAALPGIIEQYGCDPSHFLETDGLYQRHLAFDNITDPAAIGPREHFEAAARSVRAACR